MLSKGWELAPLGSVLERVVKPVKVDLAQEYREIGIRSHGKGIFHKPPILGESLGDKRVFWIVPNALVLNIVFAWEQAVAVTSESENGMIASHRFPMYRPLNGRCDLRYLLHFFKTARGKALLEIASPGGAGRNRTLGQKEFERLKVPIPPITEQVRIAMRLDTWDKSIEVVDKLIGKTISLRKVLTNDLLSGKYRLPGFSGVWRDCQIRKMGRIVSGGTPDTDESSHWNGHIPWATPTDIAVANGRYISTTARQITDSGLKASAATKLPVGSLLVCTRATICELAIATVEIATNQGFKNVVPDDGFSAEFLYHLFSAHKRQFIRLACGSTFLELSKHDFERMVFAMPTRKEQDAIARCINALDDQVTTLNSYRQQLAQEKAALVQAFPKRKVGVQ